MQKYGKYSFNVEPFAEDITGRLVGKDSGV